MAGYFFSLDEGGAEVIFAPFFDYEHSPSIFIEIDANPTVTVTRETDWCWTKIEWFNRGRGEIAFMCRCFASFDADDYDQLMAAFAVPLGVEVQFALINSDGKILGKWSGPYGGTGVRQEVILSISRLLSDITAPRALARLVRLRPRKFGGLAIRVSSPASDSGVLTLSWLGLRNKKAYATLQKVRTVFDWSPWVLERRCWGESVPQLGLLFTRAQLLDLRVKKNKPAWRAHFALLEAKARRYMHRHPETDFGDYLPNHDRRYARATDSSTSAWHWEALVLAFVGLVNDDEDMINHALRYFMCMIHTRNWTDGAESRIPSSAWNWRSFMEEMTTTSVAILLDWIGFALTPQAKTLALQALWTRGMAPVQRDLYQFDYMHKMNQGAVFCRALILGGLTLEKEWPRAGKVADEAYQTMKDVLSRYIKADGGVSEGPGYLCQTITAALWSIIAYSRARNLNWRNEAEQLFKSVEQYVRVMAASKPGRCIPSGDCRLEWFSGDLIPILAAIFPNSAYTDILMECMSGGWVHELTGTLKGSGGMIGMVYGPEEVVPSRSIAAPSLWLPDSGKFSRIIDLDGRALRLWITTHTLEASHSHSDHGSFVIEFDESPIFIDRGMVEYWKPDLMHQMQRSYTHNVLTPLMPDGSWADQSVPCIPPSSQPTVGDWPDLLLVPSQDVWTGKMDAYERIFRQGRTRKDVFIVKDTGKLSALGNVAFHLHSPYKFTICGYSVTAQIAGVSFSVDFPWAQRLTVRKSIPDFAGREIFHICAVSSEVLSFDLTTTISVF